MKLITEGMLMEMATKSREIVLETGSRLTPSARDYATMMGLTIIQKHDRYITRESRRLAPHQEVQAPPASPLAANIKDIGVNELVQKVMVEFQHQACPNPRATHVKNGSFQIRPFSVDVPGLKMGLADVVTSREANLAAGFMTFDHSELPWHMAYDEVDYVIEGDYVLKVDNQVFRARPGDVLYIPKGSQVVFSSPGFVKVFYVTYPSGGSWQGYWDSGSKENNR
jgi:ethanolamine utilization protein EutQ